MTDQLWKPDKQVRAAICRGDKLHREYFKRKSLDYQLALIGRLIAHQAPSGVRYRCNQ